MHHLSISPFQTLLFLWKETSLFVIFVSNRDFDSEMTWTRLLSFRAAGFIIGASTNGAGGCDLYSYYRPICYSKN